MRYFILTILLFQNAYGNEASRTQLEIQRIDSIQRVATKISQDSSYQVLLGRIEILEQKLKDQGSADDPKKNVMKMIGYSSSTVGLITSIWGIYEKSLSLKNSLTELEIRNKTHQVLSSEKTVLESMERTAKVEEALAKKTQILTELNEKIANIKLRIRISRMGLARGVFKGFAAVGIFALTLFIDDVMAWIYKKMPPKIVAAQFLDTWDRVYCEASIFQTQDLKPWEKAMFYYADTETLGISEDDFLDALEEYRQRNPDGYRRFVTVAEHELHRLMLDSLFREIDWVEMRINAMSPIELKYYIAEPDGTYVAPPVSAGSYQ